MSGQDRQHVTVSVMIPMRNEARFVARCLDSVLAQMDDRQDIEVLCVDGASEDGTREVVLDYASRDRRVRLIDNPARIVPVALNLAHRQARGEVLIRLDCHAEYAEDYIDACLRVLERTGADVVGGYMRTEPASDTSVGRAIAAATSSRFGVGGSAFRTGGGEMEVDTVPFGCFRRSVFERFGSFDERLVRNQDLEFNSRVRAGGGTVVISPEIRLTYYNRSTFKGIWQQAFRNGQWNPYTLYLTGGGLRPRHFVPLLFVLSLPALAVGGLGWRPLWLVLAGEAAVYLAAGSVMAVRAAPSRRASPLLVLAAFMVLHVAYGLGSLWGLLSGPFLFVGERRRRAGRALGDRRD